MVWYLVRDFSELYAEDVWCVLMMAQYGTNIFCFKLFLIFAYPKLITQ
jgi:hypothetical protein